MKKSREIRKDFELSENETQHIKNCGKLLK